MRHPSLPSSIAWLAVATIFAVSTPPRAAPQSPDPLFASDALLELTSDHGTITAVAAADDTLRPGVVSITHGYGALPGDDDDPRRYGANPARLLSLTDHRQPVSLMPWMSAVPVTVRTERSADGDGVGG